MASIRGKKKKQKTDVKSRCSLDFLPHKPFYESLKIEFNYQALVDHFKNLNLKDDHELYAVMLVYNRAVEKGKNCEPNCKSSDGPEDQFTTQYTDTVLAYDLKKGGTCRTNEEIVHICTTCHGIWTDKTQDQFTP